MKRLRFDDEGTQDGMYPGPGVEGLRREREDDSQGLGASVSRPTSVTGAGTTAEQDSRIQRVQDKLNTVMEAIRGKAPSTMEALVQRTDHLFSMTIMSHPLPKKFYIPLMEPFDGSKDPFDHLETYKTLMLLHDYSDGVMCRAFLATLKSSTRKWFNSLQPNIINSFSELSESFASHFIGGRCYRWLATYLLNVK